jgi:hypothetical protein
MLKSEQPGRPAVALVADLCARSVFLSFPITRERTLPSSEELDALGEHRRMERMRANPIRRTRATGANALPNADRSTIKSPGRRGTCAAFCRPAFGRTG